MVPKGEQWPSDVYLPKDLQRVTGPPRSSARELVVVRVFPTAPSMNLNSPQVTRGREYVREIVPPAGNSSAPPAAGPVASPSTVLWLPVRRGYARATRFMLVSRSSSAASASPLGSSGTEASWEHAAPSMSWRCASTALTVASS